MKMVISTVKVLKKAVKYLT